MRLILVRHGETDWNRAGRIIGTEDIPLNPTGIAQANAIARALEVDFPFHVYSSPVARARETALVISQALHVPISYLDALAEVNVGEMGGLTEREMHERYPDFTREWLENPATARPPGGESMAEAQERAWRAVAELMKRHPQDTVVAVSHKFAILTILFKMLDMDLRHFQRIEQDLGAITRLEISDSRGCLVSLNETLHLRAPGPAGGGGSRGQR